jgi:predicted small lipoprotein YifL
VRRLPLVALLLLPLAGCGDSGPPPKEPVVQAVRQWFKSARVGDQDRFCSNTFMAYDVPTRLWKRIGADFDAPGPPVAPPPARVLQNCREEYSFKTFFDRPVLRATRVVRVPRIRIGSPVRRAGGITNTASAVAVVRDKEGIHRWPLHLVEYRGRWRVLLHYD